MDPDRLKEIGIGLETGGRPFEAARPLLLMIHGAGGNSEVWRNQLRQLSDALNPLAIDLPGHGKTKGAALGSIQAYGSWLSETIEALSDGPVYLMGHSMGGAVAQETALRHPHLLKGLILAATGPRLKVAPAFLQGLKSDFEKTVDSIMGHAYAPEADPLLIKEGARLMKEAGQDVVSSDFEACDRFDRSDELAGISLPTLVLCGEDDNLTPPRLSTRLHEAIPGSELVVLPRGGHMVMIEQAEAFNREIRAFILKKGCMVS